MDNRIRSSLRPDFARAFGSDVAQKVTVDFWHISALGKFSELLEVTAIDGIARVHVMDDAITDAGFTADFQRAAQGLNNILE